MSDPFISKTCPDEPSPPNDSADRLPAPQHSEAEAGVRYREDQLIRFAYRIMERLQGSRAQPLKTIVPDALKDLVKRAGASEAHLFRVRTTTDGYRTAALKYSSSSRQIEALSRFPFQLLSTRLQTCLLDDQSAIIDQDRSHSGGPLVEAILKQTNCRVYLLCPLIVKGKLKGILGVTTDEPQGFDRNIRRLLKFSGMSLFLAVRNARREARQRRRFREWKQIADQACDLAFTIDESRIIQRAVAPGRSTSLSNLEGRSLKELVDPPFHSELMQAIDRSIHQAAVRTAGFRMTTGSDESRWYAARIEPSPQEPQRITLYLTDNHADQLRQEQLRALQTQLRKTERLRLLGKMSTEFAHQLTQPMQATLNYCHLLQKHIQAGTDTPEESLRWLENMEASIDHGHAIIYRIREFLREGRLMIETVSVAELLDTAVLLVSPTAQDMNAVLVVPESGTGVEVEADRTQTAHILVNLVVNALEACRDFNVPNPHIEINVDTDDAREVAIRVKDNGPGLSQDRLENLFEEFRSDKKGGVGIGLTMSRDICRAQQGDLTAANHSDGPGCTFRFTIPRTESDGGDTAEWRPLHGQFKTPD